MQVGADCAANLANRMFAILVRCESITKEIRVTDTQRDELRRLGYNKNDLKRFERLTGDDVDAIIAEGKPTCKCVRVAKTARGRLAGRVLHEAFD